MRTRRKKAAVTGVSTAKQRASSAGVFLPGKNDHSLIIDFRYTGESLAPLFELEQMLEKEIENHQLGKFDGHGISLEDKAVSLFMYAPNARKLFRQIRHVLKKAPFMRNADVYMRFGPLSSETRQEQFKLKFR